MRFCLVDRIEHLEVGARISAIKALSLAEEYLGDHFPGFPVMPGVLMLEAILPNGMTVEDATALLENLKKELNVEIAVRTITPVSL